MVLVGLLLIHGFVMVVNVGIDAVIVLVDLLAVVATAAVVHLDPKHHPRDEVIDDIITSVISVSEHFVLAVFNQDESAHPVLADLVGVLFNIKHLGRVGLVLVMFGI